VEFYGKKLARKGNKLKNLNLAGQLNRADTVKGSFTVKKEKGKDVLGVQDLRGEGDRKLEGGDRPVRRP